MDMFAILILLSISKRLPNSIVMPIGKAYDPSWQNIPTMPYDGLNNITPVRGHIPGNGRNINVIMMFCVKQSDAGLSFKQ